jgi:hypothetical protein
MLGSLEQLTCGATLDNLAAVHDDELLTEASNQSKVVAYNNENGVVGLDVCPHQLQYRHP